MLEHECTGCRDWLPYCPEPARWRMYATDPFAATAQRFGSKHAELHTSYEITDHRHGTVYTIKQS